MINYLENRDNNTKVKNDNFFKKITNDGIKHQSVNKAKKITNINYVYKNNSKNLYENNYSKYLKKYNDNNTSGMNIINKKLNKILHNNDEKGSIEQGTITITEEG